MDRFLKALATIALAAAYTFCLSIVALAADKGGGGCCADLEERVAELEATVAKKGNRKVTVTIYGQVNKAILWHDGFSAFGGKDARGVIDNTNSPTMFGLTGVAKISPTWSAGYRIEIGANENPVSLVTFGIDNELEIRRNEAWLEGPAGKFTIGKTPMASSGTGSITVANTLVAAKLLSLEPLSSNVLFGFNLPYDSDNTLRRDAVRWDSPAFAGFIVSASWASPGGVGILSQLVDKDAYDVAVRYAGEFGGFRIAGAAAYRKENYTIAMLPFLNGRNEVYTASGSVMHMQSGLFANIAAGLAKAELFPGSGIDHNTVHGQVGWEKNVSGLGTTTIYAEAGRFHADMFDGTPKVYGLGVVQKIDAAAMDLYASYRQYDLDSGGPKINVLMAGTRIQF